MSPKTAHFRCKPLQIKTNFGPTPRAHLPAITNNESPFYFVPKFTIPAARSSVGRNFQSLQYWAYCS